MKSFCYLLYFNRFHHEDRVARDGVGFDLEGHLVRILSFAQREIVPEVLLQYGSILVLLDGRKHQLVNVDLVLLPLVRSLKLSKLNMLILLLKFS